MSESKCNLTLSENYPIPTPDESYAIINAVGLAIYWTISTLAMMYYIHVYKTSNLSHLSARPLFGVFTIYLSNMILPFGVVMQLILRDSSLPQISCEFGLIAIMWALPLSCFHEIVTILFFNLRRGASVAISKIKVENVDGDDEGRSRAGDDMSLSFRYRLFINPRLVIGLHISVWLLFIFSAVILMQIDDHQLYFNGCKGCFPPSIALFVGAGLIFIFVGMAQVLAFRVRHDPDFRGLLFEALVAFGAGGGLCVIGAILMVIDPGNIYNENKFAWIWLVQIAALIVHLNSTVVQIYIARKEQASFHEVDKNLRRATSTRGLLTDILSDQEFLELFEKHVQCEFSSENLSCYQACVAWKQFFDLRRVDFREKRARLIYDSWIKRDASVVPVNISHDLVDEITAGLNNSSIGITKNLFDGIIKELGNILANDSLPRFLKSEAFQVADEKAKENSFLSPAGPPSPNKSARFNQVGPLSTQSSKSTPSSPRGGFFSN